MSAQQAAAEPFFSATDLGSMKLFVQRFVEQIRYVPGWGWHVWDGRRWARDDTGAIWRLAKLMPATWEEEAARSEGAGLTQRAEGYRRWAHQSESNGKLGHMLKFAETDSAVVARSTLFDQDPMLLNVLNGTVPLHSGNLMSHQPVDLITKLAGARFDPTAEAPIWEAFLTRVVPDLDIYTYLQRAVGYTLTGLTSEQVFFLLHGSGANGKSTFLNTLASVLGDYAAFSRPETFMARKQESVPNDIAALVGARMVITSETEDGQRFAESLVKRLTGNDVVVGRLLYREFFSFRPAFKLWLGANHLPQVRDTAESMWRRIHCIPFTVSIPPEERDPLLLDRLKGEAAGILNWAILGCMAWQEMGLAPPPAVQAATAKYRNDQDVLGQFLAETCEIDPAASIPKGELYARWQAWCETNNERAGSQPAFGRRMRERPGIAEGEIGHKNTRSWLGVGLRPTAQ